MLDTFRRLKLVAAFVGARRADYLELAALEWTDLGRSLVVICAAAVVAMLALLFFLGFLSFAVVVSAWDSDWRVATAWIVAVAWLALGAGGGAVIWSKARRLRPFEHVREELTKDVAVVRTAL